MSRVVQHLGITVILGVAVVMAACGEGNTNGGKDEGSGEPGHGSAPVSTKTSSGPAPTIVSKSRGAASTFVNPGVPQTQATLPGLTVRVTERQSLPAEEAFATGLYLIRNAQNPFVELPKEDRDRLLATLKAAGFAESDVTLTRNPSAGPYTSIRVRVPLGSVATDGPKVFKAISDSIGAAEQTGAVFGFKDCTASLATVRRAAFAAADERAKAAAAAGNLKLGAVTAAFETFGGVNPYEPGAGDRCDASGGTGFKGIPGTGLKAVDAKPEVDVTLNLAVTYALAGDGAANATGITVTGSGSVTATADEAYIVVFVETSSGPTGPRPLASKDREALMAALKQLGLKDDDIDIVNGEFGGPTLVSVETTDFAKLARLGRDVEGAVEDTVGRVFNKGVVFTHSRCDVALAEARKEAMSDAADRAAGLAAASGRKTGAVRTVAEATPINPYGGPQIADPCSEDLSALALGGGYGGGQGIKDFSAEPQFEVKVSLTVTYAFAE